MMEREKKVSLWEYSDALESLTPKELDELKVIQDAEYFKKYPGSEDSIAETVKALRDCMEKNRLNQLFFEYSKSVLFILFFKIMVQ